jgi:hypothetical protein
MALTRSFKETVKARVQADRAFRAALLREAVQSLLSGDVETGKSVLRDYINAPRASKLWALRAASRPRACCACSAPPHLGELN